MGISSPLAPDLEQRWVAWDLSYPIEQPPPSHAVSHEWDSMRQHGVNIEAVWGGAEPPTAFWKNEGFISRAVGPPQKGLGGSLFTLPFSPLPFSSNCHDLGTRATALLHPKGSRSVCRVEQLL